MDAEKKLVEYRARKRKQAYFDKANGAFKSLLSIRLGPKLTAMESKEDDTQQLLTESSDDEEIVSDVENEEYNACFIKITTYSLCAILWVTLFVIFIELQFGIVYCVITALIGICLNTRSGPKKKNEISAYSVFNQNCESIDGTLKAEQFEREIRFGAAAVR